MASRIGTLVGVAALLVSSPAAGLAEEEAIAQARTSAQAWLALLDQAEYDQSWEEAGELLQAAVGRDEWSRKWSVTRGPLGAVKSRAIRSSEYMTTLPNAPEGEYVEIKFDTTFENTQTALEAVALRRESDGIWRVSGYFIR